MQKVLPKDDLVLALTSSAEASVTAASRPWRQVRPQQQWGPACPSCVGSHQPCWFQQHHGRHSSALLTSAQPEVGLVAGACLQAVLGPCVVLSSLQLPCLPGSCLKTGLLQSEECASASPC